MLVFAKERLVFLAVPKAASTSVEAVLADRAETWLPKTKFPKHTTANMFFKRWKNQGRPRGAPPPEAFAILRDPVDRMSSWYHYRRRPGMRKPEHSTADVTFEEFIEEYLGPEPRPFAQVGNQFRFCTDPEGRMLVRYLFSYADLSHLERFIAERFGIACDLPRLNASNSRREALPPGLMARLEAANAPEFDLYRQVESAGWKTFETPGR